MPNISYVDEGKGDIILFLHGWGQNKEMMIPLIDELKLNYRCIVIDLPGFGKSSFNNVKTLDLYTKELKKFLDLNNISPNYIVGHSFGGKVAVDYYLKYRNINGLALLASPILKPKRTIKYYFKVLKYKTMKKLRVNISANGSEDYKKCLEEMRPFFVDVVNTHFDKEVSNILVPTLLMWGNKDSKVPVGKAKKLNKKIKNSYLYIQKGGHFAYLENIEFTKLIIQNFIRRIRNG